MVTFFRYPLTCPNPSGCSCCPVFFCCRDRWGADAKRGTEEGALCCPIRLQCPLDWDQDAKTGRVRIRNYMLKGKLSRSTTRHRRPVSNLKTKLTLGLWFGTVADELLHSENKGNKSQISTSSAQQVLPFVQCKRWKLYPHQKKCIHSSIHFKTKRRMEKKPWIHTSPWPDVWHWEAFLHQISSDNPLKAQWELW